MINNMVDELNGRREEEDMQAAIMASMNDRQFKIIKNNTMK